MRGERFPLDPVRQIIEARWREPNPAEGVHLSHIGWVGKAVDVTGIDAVRFYGWAKNGLTDKAADRLALALGYHPGNIWPEQWWSVEPLDEERVA